MTSVEKTKFEELRALKVLQLLLPEKYREAYLFEAPDIVDPKMSIGVEVTSSMGQKAQQGHARVGELTGKKPGNLTKRNISQIDAEGIDAFLSPAGDVFAVFTHWGDLHDLAKAYHSKTETLNKPHFSVKRENNLFIIAWLIDQGELEFGIRNLTIDRVVESKCDGRIRFDNVYVLTERLLLELGSGKKAINKHWLSESQMSSINNSAFEDIFGVSRSEYYGRGHDPIECLE